MNTRIYRNIGLTQREYLYSRTVTSSHIFSRQETRLEENKNETAAMTVPITFFFSFVVVVVRQLLQTLSILQVFVCAVLFFPLFFSFWARINCRMLPRPNLTCQHSSFSFLGYFDQGRQYVVTSWLASEPHRCHQHDERIIQFLMLEARETIKSYSLRSTALANWTAG